MAKILRGTIISIASLIFILPISVSAQDIVAVRYIPTALADRDGIIDVWISFTVPQGLIGGFGISEKIPDGWNATDISSSPSASSKFNQSKIELLWTTNLSGKVYVSYKLRIPGDAPYADDYILDGNLVIGNKTILIEGDDIVIVSSQRDTKPPIIHSVKVSNVDANLYVTANVTDDFMVYSVTANNRRLTRQGGYNWSGVIPAESGTNIPVVIVAKDVAGKIAADSSQKYNYTIQATYPSISGVHNGTITLTQTLTVHNLYTYPVPGTGGHSEYAAFYRNGLMIANATWNGYQSDWHNITFNNFTLEANVTYDYTIRTGSYPQIIHSSSFSNSMYTMTSTEFIDANGRCYVNWIPEIRLG